MKKKIILGVCAVVIVFFVVLGILIARMPDDYYKSQLALFDGMTPVKVYTSDESRRYFARYDITLTQWQEIEQKITDYSFVGTGGSYRSIGTAPDYESEFFTDEELEAVTDVYYLSTYVGVQPFNRCYSQGKIFIIPMGENVSVYFSIIVYDGMVK